MTGVEILAMEDIVIDTAFNWIGFLISFGIILCVFIVTGIVISVSSGDWINVAIGIVVGIGFGGVFGTGLGFAFGIPAEYETQYKVIITDEVSMDDFFSKYELIEQDGRIYTVTER